VKENTGYLIGNQQMEAEGKALKLEGEAEYKAAVAVQAAEATGDKVKGTVKETVGHVLGNESLEGEGKADHLKGQVKDATNV